MNLPVKAPPKSLARRHYDEDQFSEALSAFESETTAVFVETKPGNERIILHVLVLMLVLSVTLSAFVKLDRVVTGVGQVVSVGGPLYISPLETGVMREVRVKAGDIVKKGQVLATLDPTLTQADVDQLRQKIASDEAQLERLLAERSATPLILNKDQPYAELQLSLWRQRKTEYEANLANFDAQILNARAVVAQYQQNLEQYSKRMELASDVEQMYEPLVRKGYVSQLQLNSAQDTKEEMTRLRAQAQNQIASARQSEAAVRAQRSAYMEKWLSEVAVSLVATRNSLDAAKENLQKAERMLELSTLVAPADAIVLKIGKVSSGSIASSSASPFQDQLFTLAPLDAPLEAEIKVLSPDIGFIRVSDPLTIKFDSYSFIQHGTAKGTVKSISEGSFTTDENNAPTKPYFKVRVKISELNLRNVPDDFRLIPGMTMVGDIMVGKRTLFSYLVEGALRTGSEAMREAQ
jgi:HlyD family type I secretion membrane fusion protein